MGLITKVWTWILANGASVLGALQALVKAIKELITAFLNLISIFFPTATFEAFILKTRDIVNVVDGWLEKMKSYLIPKV